jgi:hypothetical protein
MFFWVNHMVQAKPLPDFPLPSPTEPHGAAATSPLPARPAEASGPRASAPPSWARATPEPEPRSQTLGPLGFLWITCGLHWIAQFFFPCQGHSGALDDSTCSKKILDTSGRPGHWKAGHRTLPDTPSSLTSLPACLPASSTQPLSRELASSRARQYRTLWQARQLSGPCRTRTLRQINCTDRISDRMPDKMKDRIDRIICEIKCQNNVK